MTERWRDFYTEEQLRRLQEIETDNLRIFIDVCERMQLEYFAYGGTLLGVEKFQGMIPWDDDIDVAMPRDSYRRFAEHAAEYLPENCFIQTPYDGSRSPFPYIKLRRRGTAYVEYINRNLKMETGIYIDIYPVDRIPDEEKLRKKQFKKVQKWILCYVLRQGRLFDKDDPGVKGKLKNAAKWCLCHMLKIFPQSFFIQNLDRNMTMYNGCETERYAALNSPNYDNIYLNLYPLTEGRFGDLTVKIPGDHRTHLRMRYGDYMSDLPEDRRYGHVPYILDLGGSGEKDGECG